MTSIIIAILFLAVLIFVHELGHFIAAKVFGVYVDRFSLGMPPRLVGFKWGETDYSIGLLPIGGYVKMAGQEDVPQTEEEREEMYGHVPPDRWFNNKPRWQRAIIFFAGPLMNFVLAFIVYALIAAFGQEVPLSDVDTRVGMLEPGSPASVAPLFLATEDADGTDFQGLPAATGWQTGDRILTINGKTMGGIEDIAMEGFLGVGKTAVVEIERIGPAGAPLRYWSPVEPKVLDDSDLARFGIARFETALVAHVLSNTPASRHGLKPGDMIVRANGKTIDKLSFAALVRETPPDQSIAVEIEREGEGLSFDILPQAENTFEESKISFSPELRPLIEVGEEGGATIVLDDSDLTKQTGLVRGDVVKTLNGEPATGQRLRAMVRAHGAERIQVGIDRPSRGFGFLQAAGSHTLEMPFAKLLEGLTGIDEAAKPEVAQITSDLSESTGLKRGDVLLEVDGQPATAALLREIERTRPGETITLKVKRDPILFGILRDGAAFDTEITVSSTQRVGVVWGVETVFRRETPSQIIPYAWGECYRVASLIGSLLSVLIQGDVNPSKAIGGPVMIIELTSLYAKASFVKLLEFMALISVNLCIINLLPIPVLDGGQLLFLGIEAIRRKPLSVRFMETVQQVAIFLLIGFFVYVTFNDFSRIVTRMIQ